MTAAPRQLDFTKNSVESEVARLKGLRRLVLFIHGFNNDHDEAIRSYRALTIELAAVRVPIDRLATIWHVFWPGYVRGLRPTSRRPITAALYSVQVPKAKQFGKEIGEALRKLPGFPDIYLIAHSLGCRVALEAIRVIASAGPGPALCVPKFCLMAAAVPTSMLERGGQLFVEASDSGYVLFSRRDRVLRWAFPAGQSVLGREEGGWFPKAVGLQGQPAIWKHKAETMFGHSQYWGDPFTAHHVARLFGVATPIKIDELPLVSWELPEPASLPPQALPRHLPGSLWSSEW